MDINNENKGRINIARSRPKTHECRWETSELKIIRNSFAFLIIIEAMFESSERVFSGLFRVAHGQVDLTYKCAGVCRVCGVLRST